MSGGRALPVWRTWPSYRTVVIQQTVVAVAAFGAGNIEQIVTGAVIVTNPSIVGTHLTEDGMEG